MTHTFLVPLWSAHERAPHDDRSRGPQNHVVQHAAAALPVHLAAHPRRAQHAHGKGVPRGGGLLRHVLPDRPHLALQVSYEIHEEVVDRVRLVDLAHGREVCPRLGEAEAEPGVECVDRGHEQDAHDVALQRGPAVVFKVQRDLVEGDGEGEHAEEAGKEPRCTRIGICLVWS